MSLIPRDYQREAIGLAQTANVLLTDECGLGKTLVAIEAVAAYWAGGQRGPTLVVAPKSVREQWYEMITKQLPNASVAILGVAGRLPGEINSTTELKHYDFVITHYEGLLGAGRSLAKINWLMIIADEAHRIKNRKAKRAMWIKLLPARHKMALTGTPMDHRPDELWSMINWLYPRVLTSYWKWRETHCEIKETWAGYEEVIGTKDPAALGRVLSPFTLHRTKQAVAPELPPKIFTYVPLELEGQQLKLYQSIAKQAKKDIVVNLDEFRDFPHNDPLLILNKLSLIMKLQQAASNPHILGVDIDGAKWDWLMDYVTDNPDETMVIFSKFRDTAIRLASALKAALVIGGSRTPILDAAPFLTGTNRLLVGTIAAMGEGLNLQRARTAIFLDMEWSSIKMQQAIDRIHRIDITEPKQIIYLLAQNTVDQLVHKALNEKWSETTLVYKYLEQEALT